MLSKNPSGAIEPAISIIFSRDIDFIMSHMPSPGTSFIFIVRLIAYQLKPVGNAFSALIHLQQHINGRLLLDLFQRDTVFYAACLRKHSVKTVL